MIILSVHALGQRDRMVEKMLSLWKWMLIILREPTVSLNQTRVDFLWDCFSRCFLDCDLQFIVLGTLPNRQINQFALFSFMWLIQDPTESCKFTKLKAIWLNDAGSFYQRTDFYCHKDQVCTPLHLFMTLDYQSWMIEITCWNWRKPKPDFRIRNKKLCESNNI